MCPGSWTNIESLRDFDEVECAKKSVLKLMFEGRPSDLPNDDMLGATFDKLEHYHYWLESVKTIKVEKS